jgi:hypothetical protein
MRPAKYAVEVSQGFLFFRALQLKWVGEIVTADGGKVTTGGAILILSESRWGKCFRKIETFYRFIFAGNFGPPSFCLLAILSTLILSI